MSLVRHLYSRMMSLIDIGMLQQNDVFGETAVCYSRMLSLVRQLYVTAAGCLWWDSCTLQQDEVLGETSVHYSRMMSLVRQLYVTAGWCLWWDSCMLQQDVFGETSLHYSSRMSLVRHLYITAAGCLWWDICTLQQQDVFGETSLHYSRMSSVRHLYITAGWCLWWDSCTLQQDDAFGETSARYSRMMTLVRYLCSAALITVNTRWTGKIKRNLFHFIITVVVGFFFIACKDLRFEDSFPICTALFVCLFVLSGDQLIHTSSTLQAKNQTTVAQWAEITVDKHSLQLACELVSLILYCAWTAKSARSNYVRSKA